MNVITFDGRLTKDAELKQLQTNTVCNFDVACNIGYGDRKKTIYLRCDLWNKRAESLHSYLKKGNQERRGMPARSDGPGAAGGENDV